MRAHVRDLVEQVNNRGTIYEIGTFDTPTGPWEVILVEIGTGNVAAAIATERAVVDWQTASAPRGRNGGGFRDRVRLGDVVVATTVESYELGKLRSFPEFGHETNVLVLSHRMQQRAIKEAARRGWFNVGSIRRETIRRLTCTSVPLCPAKG